MRSMRHVGLLNRPQNIHVHTFGGIFSHQLEHQTRFRLAIAVSTSDCLNTNQNAVARRRAANILEGPESSEYGEGTKGAPRERT